MRPTTALSCLRETMAMRAKLNGTISGAQLDRADPNTDEEIVLLTKAIAAIAALEHHYHERAVLK